MTRLYRSPIWEIFIGDRYANCKYLLLIFIPHLLAAALEGGSFALIFLAFSALEKTPSRDSSFFNPAYWGWQLTGMESFYFYVLAAVGLQAIRGLVSFLALYGTSLFSLKVQTDAQKRIYQQIFRFSFPFVSQYKIGDLSESAKSPASFIPTLFEAINRFSVSLCMCMGLISVLCWLSMPLTLLTLVLFLLFAIFQKTLIKKVLLFSEQLTHHLFEFSHQTVQSLQGIRPIHIFYRQKFILKKIESVLQRIAISSKKAHFWNNVIPTLNETVNVLLVGTILILGSVLLSNGDGHALPNLLTYVALTYRLATRLQIAMSGLGSISLHYGPVLRLNEILEEKDKEYDPVAGLEFSGWNQEIQFRNVTLYYPKASKPALNDLSFSIPKGSSVALVGLSGAGKSSVLDLILGLQRPTKGEILVDAQLLHSFSQESWRRKIGVVSQDTFIFNGTIEENIRFGDLDASDADLLKAAELAGASEFISHLPERFKTVTGERGYKLSGGERQRIALARALLRNPEILVLDEATSNLDSCSEEMIQNSLAIMGKSKTLIVVAHRLSTIVTSDAILVLEQGRIIERGRHEDLLALQGRYAQLWELQSRKDYREIGNEISAY